MQSQQQGTGRFYFLTLSLLCLGLGYMCYLVIRPFLEPIAWASLLTIIFFPVNSRLKNLLRIRYSASVASLITLVLVMLITLGPVSYILFLLVNELRGLAGYMGSDGFDQLLSFFELPEIAWLFRHITELFQVPEATPEAFITENLREFGKNMAGNLARDVKDLFLALVDFGIMFFSLFFLLRDGPTLIERIKGYMPFPEKQRNRVAKLIKEIVVSTIFGGVVVAVVQGTLAGIAYYIVDIRAPVLWGSLTGLMSFIPMLGAFSVWFSLTIYLVVIGSYGNALLLFLFGSLGISLVDNILKPVIIGERMKMPTLMIFFCVLGGLKVFGPIGLILGPMVMALFIAIFEIFRNLEQRHEGEKAG